MSNYSLNALQSTKNISANGYKIVIYGDTGVGKTHLVKTAPNPFLLASERKLSPLNDSNIPYVTIESLQDLVGWVEWFTFSNEAKQFETLAIDSFSEIGELILADELPKHKNKLQAYGAVSEGLQSVARDIMAIQGRNAYIITHQEKEKDEASGLMLYGPAMVGKQLAPALKYLFEGTWRLYTYRDKDGNLQRAIRTEGDNQYTASNSLGGLAPDEPADLTNIFNKIKNQNNHNN